MNFKDELIVNSYFLRIMFNLYIERFIGSLKYIDRT